MPSLPHELFIGKAKGGGDMLSNYQFIEPGDGATLVNYFSNLSLLLQPDSLNR